MADSPRWIRQPSRSSAPPDDDKTRRICIADLLNAARSGRSLPDGTGPPRSSRSAWIPTGALILLGRQSIRPV